MAWLYILFHCHILLSFDFYFCSIDCCLHILFLYLFKFTNTNSFYYVFLLWFLFRLSFLHWSLFRPHMICMLSLIVIYLSTNDNFMNIVWIMSIAIDILADLLSFWMLISSLIIQRRLRLLHSYLLTASHCIKLFFLVYVRRMLLGFIW